MKSKNIRLSLMTGLLSLATAGAVHAQQTPTTTPTTTAAATTTVAYVTFDSFCDVLRLEIKAVRDNNVLVFGSNVSPGCEEGSYASGALVSAVSSSRVNLVGGYTTGRGTASILKIMDFDLKAGTFKAYRLDAVDTGAVPTSSLSSQVSGTFRVSTTAPTGVTRSLGAAGKPSIAGSL